MINFVLLMKSVTMMQEVFHIIMVELLVKVQVSFYRLYVTTTTFMKQKEFRICQMMQWYACSADRQNRYQSVVSWK